MRHVAAGRHARYPYRPTGWSYLIVTLAALAALAAALVFAGQAEPAQAQPARQAPVFLIDRGAEMAVADDSAAQFARDKTVAARLAAVRVRAAAIAAALTYTVRAGQTMSGIAAGHCGTARDWTGIYAGSRARGWTARNANDLTAGQHLWLSCAYVPSMLKFAPAPPPPPVVRTVTRVVTTYHGYHRTYHRSYHRPYTAASGTYHGSGGMQACIISRESGGNAGIWNASGHYGLYQFSASTWAAHGGNSADFGHASVAEQNQVYYNTVAADGYSDWAPYDGC